MFKVEEKICMNVKCCRFSRYLQVSHQRGLQDNLGNHTPRVCLKRIVSKKKKQKKTSIINNLCMTVSYT